MPLVRVAYGTNVAPAETVGELVAALGGLWTDVRRIAAPGGTLGLGLWLPDEAARELASDPGRMRDVRAALADAQLELVTVNAFPARAFHAPVVKEAVYRPAWTEPERFAYTCAVARAVAGIAPPGSDITLSTLPVGFPKLSMPERLQAAALLLATVLELHRLQEVTGTTIRLALEPEPCCAIETVDELIEFFGVCVLPLARHLAGAGVPASVAEDVVRRHLGACLDLCHLAVGHEDPIDAMARLHAADVPVFKVQVSAAVEVSDPSNAANRAALARFVEPRWLHQVGAPGGLVVLDLPQALHDASFAKSKPWRVHFHVPLHEETVGGLPTTRRETARFLRHVATLDDPPVLEIETYTWSVVPGASGDLAANIAAEIGWVRRELESAH
jgi:sugar phosphate isomerase/epimerase